MPATKIYTIHDTHGVVNTGGSVSQRSFKDRHCPGMRSCWTFSFSSYSLLNTTSKEVLARRTCMILTLALRTAISVLGLVRQAVRGHLLSGEWILTLILTILGFLFVAWALATIGEAQGERKVMSELVGRWHLDIFLIACAAIHALMFAGAFFGWYGIGLSWIVMWLLIFGTAWLCTWEPELPGAVMV